MNETPIKHAPTLAMLRGRRVEILKLTERYGVSNIRVFGSTARGEATTDSDVDLLVTVPDGVSVFDLVGLWLDLQDILECSVSIVADDTPDEHFMRNVLQDAVPL